MKEIIFCLALILVLFLLYYLFGRLTSVLFSLHMNHIMTILLGVFVYYGLFQIIAEPLIFLRKSLRLLTICWIAVLFLVFLFALFLFRRRAAQTAAPLVSDRSCSFSAKKLFRPMMLILLAVMALQFYYIITGDYLGWDTASYVGTVSNSLAHNNMYRYVGETGKPYAYLDMRYILSAFYMHSAVWCRILNIRALYMEKIVQGGVMSILYGMLMYQIGCFLFTARRYQSILKKEQISDAAAGFVIMVTIINIFFHSIFSASDFLLSRAMEAKSYCANLILPCIFLYGIMLWRDHNNREARFSLLAASLGSVAISMSALVTAPALVTILLLPVLIAEKKWAFVKYYFMCIFFNVIYLIIYVLFELEIFRIGV